jgi:hypothetical protein
MLFSYRGGSITVGHIRPEPTPIIVEAHTISDNTHTNYSTPRTGIKSNKDNHASMKEYTLFNEETERLMLENNNSVIAVKVAHPNQVLNVATRLGAALLGNTHVKDLRLYLENFAETDDVTLLLQWLEGNASLIEIHLVGGTSRILVVRLLQAITSNSLIPTILLYKIDLYTENLTLLLQAPSIQALFLLQCEILDGPLANESATLEHVHSLFASNTTLTNLQLEWNATNTQFMNTILQAQQTRRVLVRLDVTGPAVDFEFPDTASNALAQIINSTTGSPTCIGFGRMSWNEASFEPIAAACQTSSKIQSLAFSNCYFDEASSKLLPTICQSKFLQRLHIKRGVQFTRKVNVLGNLVRSICQPITLDMRGFNRWNDARSGFRDIVEGLQATERASMVRVRFGQLSMAQCEWLIECLPAIRGLRHIEFSLDEECSHRRDGLLSAFRRNGSVMSSGNVEAPFLTETDHAKLRLYALRNQKVRESLLDMEQSETNTRRCLEIVPKLFWLSLHANAAAGPRDVYRSLLRLGDSVGVNSKVNQDLSDSCW